MQTKILGAYRILGKTVMVQDGWTLHVLRRMGPRVCSSRLSKFTTHLSIPTTPLATGKTKQWHSSAHDSARHHACGYQFWHYSRSPKNPALQLLQKSFKSASTTPQRPIWNSFATVGVRDFWENGCKHLGRLCFAVDSALKASYSMAKATQCATAAQASREGFACGGVSRPRNERSCCYVDSPATTARVTR